MTFQQPHRKRLDRKDHVWFRDGGRWKCCLCGAVTPFPPHYPTPPDWAPSRYEELTADERGLCPR